MELQHFFAPSMRQAINLVRNSLGPDAIIFSHKKVNGGIEIEAATDRETDTQEQPAQQTPKIPSPSAENLTPASQSPSETTDEPAMTLVPDDLLNSMQDEISMLRDLMENQLAGLAWNNKVRQNSGETALLKRLSTLGLDPEVCRFICQQLPNIQNLDTAWTQAQHSLINNIKTTGDELLHYGGIAALIGPTGVGKTTTIAKIASRFALHHSADEIGLITTDTYRVAAREQLNIYGRILHIPVISIATEKELNKALEKFQNKRLILIDTAGMSPRNMELNHKLELLNQAERTVKSYLVMPTNTQTGYLNETINAFNMVKINACILTKLDETTSLGPCISALIKHGLPVAYVSNGQRVPEDLKVARPHQLVTWAIAAARRNEHMPTDEEMALTFSQGVAHAHD